LTPSSGCTGRVSSATCPVRWLGRRSDRRSGDCRTGLMRRSDEAGRHRVGPDVRQGAGARSV
jgi:hypothetical protein